MKADGQGSVCVTRWDLEAQSKPMGNVSRNAMNILEKISEILGQFRVVQTQSFVAQYVQINFVWRHNS